MNKKQKKMLYRILAATALMILFVLLPVEGYLRFACFMIPYVIIGYDILRKAWKGIKNRQPFDGICHCWSNSFGRICGRLCGNAFLPGWGAVSELCSWKKP